MEEKSQLEAYINAVESMKLFKKVVMRAAEETWKETHGVGDLVVE